MQRNRLGGDAGEPLRGRIEPDELIDRSGGGKVDAVAEFLTRHGTSREGMDHSAEQAGRCFHPRGDEQQREPLNFLVLHGAVVDGTREVTEDVVGVVATATLINLRFQEGHEFGPQFVGLGDGPDSPGGRLSISRPVSVVQAMSASGIPKMRKIVMIGSRCVNASPRSTFACLGRSSSNSAAVASTIGS